MKQVGRRFIVGNWKTSFSSLADATGCAKNIKLPSGLDFNVVVCPSTIHLAHMSESIKNRKIFLGAQYVSSDIGYSSTGETVASQLKDTGVEFVIVGHAERRMAHDSSEEISLQIKNSIIAGITPIVCVGEVDLHNRHEVLERQVKEALEGLKLQEVRGVIFAYEPVWAIGADSTPKIEDIHSAALCIRSLISEVCEQRYDASKSLVLYGGSVNENNASIILKDAGVQGLLIGRASVDINKFNSILKCISIQA